MVCIWSLLFMSCQMQVQIGRQLRTRSRSLANIRTPLLGRRRYDEQTLGKPDSLKSGYRLFGTRAPWLIIPACFQSLVGQGLSETRSALPAALLPAPSHQSWPFYSSFVWGGSPPPFVSQAQTEKERWWVTWGKDQSRHWEKRGLTWSSVDYTTGMIYRGKCPDYLSCNKRTVQK